MRRVIIESPFAGDVPANVAYARQACKDCIRRGEVPFASHLFFPHFLDDKDPEERKLGIEMGYDFWDKAELVVFYTDKGMSPGMEKALARAFMLGKAFEKRTLAQTSEVEKFAPKQGAVDLDKLAEDLKA